jgi:hypothetical protein
VASLNPSFEQALLSLLGNMSTKAKSWFKRQLNKLVIKRGKPLKVKEFVAEEEDLTLKTSPRSESEARNLMPIELTRTYPTEQNPYQKSARGRVRYRPLNNTKKEIRLLELLPSTGTGSFADQAPVRCRVYHVSQDDDLFYYALSYVWGDEYDTVPVEIEYKAPGQSNTTIQVVHATRNLESALKHLRKEKESVILWVDALCINQSDDQEKNHQVRYMGTVFERAVEVLIWLGPAANDSDALFDFIEDIYLVMHNVTLSLRELQTFIAGVEFPMTAPASEFLDTGDLSLEWIVRRYLGYLPGNSGIPAYGARALLDRPWFTR